MIIIENTKSKNAKKFIHEVSEATGHDCWGNTDWTSHECVYIDGKSQQIFNDCYIAHDGEKVIHMGFISHLPREISTVLDPSLETKYKEERYKQYKKLCKEFSENTDENKAIKREFDIKEIIL